MRKGQSYPHLRFLRMYSNVIKNMIESYATRKETNANKRRRNIKYWMKGDPRLALFLFLSASFFWVRHPTETSVHRHKPVRCAMKGNQTHERPISDSSSRTYASTYHYSSHLFPAHSIYRLLPSSARLLQLCSTLFPLTISTPVKKSTYLLFRSSPIVAAKGAAFSPL